MASNTEIHDLGDVEKSAEDIQQAEIDQQTSVASEAAETQDVAEDIASSVEETEDTASDEAKTAVGANSEEAADIFDQLKSSIESGQMPEVAATTSTPLEAVDVTAETEPTDERVNITRNLKTLHALPVDVSVILGKTELIVSDLLLMGQGSVIELDKLIGDDLDVFVNGKPIAQGTIVLSNNNFGCNISRILTPIERLRKLVMET